MKNENLKHLGIILDGNRRWAKEQGKPSLFGHKEGVEATKRVLDACLKYDIKYLTVYAFSTENWKRSEEEVGYLMALAMKHIGGGKDYFNERNIKLNIFGRMDNVRPELAREMTKTSEATKNNDALIFNVCFNYGGRMEITKAVKQIIKDGKTPDDITEELIGSYLYSGGQPDPDMIIRASGEHRLSNFLPWQGIYSELYFPKDYWPAFSEEQIKQAIEEFDSRQRRFGK